MTDPVVWGYLLAFMAFQMLLQVVVPGPEIKGPVTESGYTPVYKDNGFTCYLIDMIIFIFGAYAGWWHGGTLVSLGGPLIIRLNIFALVLCLFILWKGYYHPTTKDTRYRGDIISDYFWGCDLYPNLYGLDLKVWTNCRMGMTMWPLIVTSCIFY